LDISLPIPEQFAPKKKTTQRPPTVTTCTLEDCLHAFGELENLEDAEKYHCTKCRVQTRCSKKFFITKLPPVRVEK